MTQRTRTHGRRASLVVLGLAPALAACTSVACTAAGCLSTVGVDISSLKAAAYPLGATATLCVEGRCTTSKVTFVTGAGDTRLQQEIPTDPSPTPGGRVPVTLTVTQGSEVLLKASTTTALSRFAPNGEKCGPICWTAQLTLIGGTLVPVGSSAGPSAS